MREAMRRHSDAIALGFFITCAIFGAAILSGQTRVERGPLLWKETLTPEAKGTRISVPRSIAETIRANPDDCGNPSEQERVKVDGYKLQERNLILISVWGRSSCFCSPTGNCAFWIFRSHNGKYEPILQTHMVREFGFLPSHSNDLPDLVLWSHDSAMRFPGALWSFDGHKYISVCGWEIVTTYRDLPDGGTESSGSHVKNSNCEKKILPEHEPPEMHKN